MANDFLAKLASNIARHQLLRADRPIVAAVSGGADSVALLVGLNALGYECIAAHCNYHLRGEESNRDMRSVQQLCARLGIDLYVRDFDVEARRRASGESVEMACRELRYQWFGDLLDRQRAQAIAVAHHREDNAETFFLNLMRGSGLTGLTGMRWRNGYVVRPLLDFSRAEIEAFLATQGIDYVTDSTNELNDYKRNKLRNVVLPMLEEQFPGSIDGVLASIGFLTDNRAFYDAAMRERRDAYFDGKELQLASLIEHEAQPRMVLFEILRTLGFNMTQVDNMLESAGKSGLTFRVGTTTLILNRGVARCLCDGDQAAASIGNWHVSLRRDVLEPVKILVSEHPVAEFKIEHDPNVAFFDAEMLDGNPDFVLRRWQRGDRMHPYGMRGTKLLSDLFSNARYALDQKQNAWVLTRNGTVIWVPGLRASCHFSIKPETRRYLRLQYANN